MEKALIISNIFLWIGLVLQFALLFFFSRVLSEFLNRFRLNSQRIEYASLRVGQQAPLFRETDAQGAQVQLREEQGRQTLMLFTKDSCPICGGVVEMLPELQAAVPHLRIIVISKKGARAYPVPHGVHVLQSDNLFDNYMIDKVPAFFLIESSGMILKAEEVQAPGQMILLMKELTQQRSA